MTDLTNIKNTRLQGIAVSQGIIIGRARLIDRSKQKIVYQYLINEKEVSREVERFNEALKLTKEQIIDLKNRMSDKIKENSFILDAHLMFLDISMFSDYTF